jgi:tetratricopeptide (TPR) repeat protein
MVTVLEQVEQVYRTGCDVEAKARAAGGDLQLGVEAASSFGEACRLSTQAANDKALSADARVQAAVFAKYYEYCRYKALCWVAYERRDCKQAIAEGEAGQKSLQEAIGLIDAARDSQSPDVQVHLDRQKRSWEFERQFTTLMAEAIKGRELWDLGRFADAIDHYRRAVAKGQAAVELVQQDGVPSPSERILIGNIYGMMSNASKALTKLIFERGRTVEGLAVLDGESSIELLRHNYHAYQCDVAAYRTNPEWQQYWDSAQACLGNLKRFLCDNPDAWFETYLAFENEPEFLAMMKQVDPTKYRQAELGRMAHDRGIARLWGIGSFWLMAFFVVFGAIYLLLSVGWWSALLAIVGIPILFLLVTAAILRSSGDLSEAGFLETIKLSLRFMRSGAARFVRRDDVDGGGE